MPISVKKPKHATVACWPAKAICPANQVGRTAHADQPVWNRKDYLLMSKLTLLVKETRLKWR